MVWPSIDSQMRHRAVHTALPHTFLGGTGFTILELGFFLPFIMRPLAWLHVYGNKGFSMLNTHAKNRDECAAQFENSCIVVLYM